ncbi:uroporphyrinogen-III C-methyltransferase, uroporphyrinogen-III synthase [Thalassoporum mexicanum PCC 7367]|uniref:uroporphyrinogen-III C-methyltransferase n=1 Tax=Thalassoporum mexicanum TaxID=3457544 RepID=UPI00029FB930|nr:uroporphyrinogen-III C-methyltransferase [Pseudanabaena sp. PCC 7367]AFY68887.1 uroporphyrinogen-III C-methyltransferase, uroporphyrinogen-III synthase [Pseudanabaena sp. PCC 7367]
MTSGKVYIVGAGVGGIDYLTVKAQRLISQAEAIVYDALIDESLLALTPVSCDRHYVGKRGGQLSIKQPEINNLLVKLCQQGKQVVRLKSGDPFIFGRAVPELEALRANNCEYEIVPGISSAIAASLFSGIPLTDAKLSPCFAVLTAHDLENLPWPALAEIPTLAILMGTRGLQGENPPLLAKLRQGKSADTPIAVVQWCGSHAPEQQQKIWLGTLTDIQSKLPDYALSPAVILVGEVVRYHDRLSWFRPGQMERHNKALTGITVMVTRATGQSSQFSQMLIDTGARVVEMPTLAILPPDSWADLDRAIANLDRYDWLILTSANGVYSFFERLHHAQKDSRALTNVKVAVVGKKTAVALTQNGIMPDFIPPNYVADDLAANFPSVKNLNILFPRVQSGGREVLIEELTAKGAKVDAIAAYESGLPPERDPQALAAIKNGNIDVITFASSKTVRNFCEILAQESNEWQKWLAGVTIASIGPQTSATCYEFLGRVEIEAMEYTLDGLIEAIANYYESPHTNF